MRAFLVLARRPYRRGRGGRSRFLCRHHTASGAAASSGAKPWRRCHNVFGKWTHSERLRPKVRREKRGCRGVANPHTCEGCFRKRQEPTAACNAAARKLVEVSRTHAARAQSTACAKTISPCCASRDLRTNLAQNVAQCGWRRRQETYIRRSLSACGQQAIGAVK